MTNFEKFKQKINEMDEADLAELFDDAFTGAESYLIKCAFCTEEYCNCDDKCERHIRQWLKQEVNEDGKIH